MSVEIGVYRSLANLRLLLNVMGRRWRRLFLLRGVKNGVFKVAQLVNKCSKLDQK